MSVATVDVRRVPTTQDPVWWPATWRRLLPGDAVRAPDGSTWVVLASIECGDRGEWLIRPAFNADHPGAWSAHHLDEDVQATRPYRATPAEDLESVIGTLRLAGFDVETIKE